MLSQVKYAGPGGQLGILTAFGGQAGAAAQDHQVQGRHRLFALPVLDITPVALEQVHDHFGVRLEGEAPHLPGEAQAHLANLVAVVGKEQPAALQGQVGVNPLTRMQQDGAFLQVVHLGEQGELAEVAAQEQAQAVLQPNFAGVTGQAHQAIAGEDNRPRLETAPVVFSGGPRHQDAGRTFGALVISAQRQPALARRPAS